MLRGIIAELWFNQLPPAVFEYLQSEQSQNKVFRVARDSKYYVVELENKTVIYNVDNGSIEEPLSGEDLHYILAGEVD